MDLFSAYRFFDTLDTTAAVGSSINVLSVGYLLDSLIHRDCGSESLAHLCPEWARDRMIVLCRFCFSFMKIIQDIFGFLCHLVVRQMAVFDRGTDVGMTQNVGYFVKGHARLNQPACRGVSQGMQGTVF